MMCFTYILRDKSGAKCEATNEAVSRAMLITVIRLLNVVLCAMLIFAAGCTRNLMEFKLLG